MVLGFLAAQTIPGFCELRKYGGSRVGILLSMAFPHSSGVNHGLEELQMVKMWMGRYKTDVLLALFPILLSQWKILC